MKLIPPYVHGIIDYVVGIALLIAPNIFGFAEVGGPAVIIPRVVGLIVLLQALMTNYELGVFRLISMRTHLVNDYVLGLFLAVSPWLFGFDEFAANVWLPHFVVGLAAFFIALMTSPVPARVERTASARV